MRSRTAAGIGRRFDVRFAPAIRMGLLVMNEQRADAYEIAEHLAMLAAGKSTTIPDDVRALYARGEAGEISSDAIVEVIVARYICKTSNEVKRKRSLPGF